MTFVKSVFSIVIFLGAVSLAAGVDLVVMRDGTSYWAQRVKKEENVLSFVLNESGQATNIHLSRLHVVVPGVEKGRTYSEEDVKGSLKLISDTRICYGMLTKQLKILQGEWEAIRASSDPEMGNRINGEIEAFKASRKDKAAYSQAVFNLSMIKYKDVLGVYSTRLDNAIGAIQQEYMGTTVKQLEARAGAVNMSVDEFQEIKDAALKALKKEIPAEECKRVRDALAKARSAAQSWGIAEANALVAVNKNIDNYLKSRTILLKLKSCVAETTSEIFAVEKAIANVTQSVKSKLADYNFSNNGYPLNRVCAEDFQRTKAYSSSQMVLGTPVDEQCLVILKQVPEPTVAGTTNVLDLSLVFNRTVNINEEYSIVVVGLNGAEMTKHHTKLTRLAPRNGCAGLRFPLDVGVLGRDAIPFRDGNGGYVLLYMASRLKSEENEDDNARWKAISMACRIPVQ